MRALDEVSTAVSTGVLDVSGKGRGGECPTGSLADGFVASGNTVVACHEELQREFVGNAGLYTLSYCHLAGKSTDLFDSIDAELT